MASRITASGGDYDLSDPINSFVDVVRRVVLQMVGRSYLQSPTPVLLRGVVRPSILL
jgi:hypothetical protein